MHNFDSYWDYGGKRIIDCKECGFKHVYPIPSKDEIDQFYKEHYYKEIKPFDYDVVNREYIAKTIKLVTNSENFKKIYSKVEEFKKSSSHRMLDVGAGNNLLSKYFQLKGWESWIIEPSKDASKYLSAFGLNVIDKSIEDYNFSQKKNISFINVQFVLEHLRNPIEFLTNAYKTLEPGGIIRVSVPNDFSPGQLAYKEYFEKEPDWIINPDHINYFNFNELSKLLDKIGFEEVYRKTNFPLEFLLLGGIDYYSNEEDQQKVSPFVSNFENSFKKTNRGIELDNFYQTLAKVGFGRAIFMYGRKSL